MYCLPSFNFLMSNIDYFIFFCVADTIWWSKNGGGKNSRIKIFHLWNLFPFGQILFLGRIWCVKWSCLRRHKLNVLFYFWYLKWTNNVITWFTSHKCNLRTSHWQAFVDMICLNTTVMLMGWGLLQWRKGDVKCTCS